MLTDAKTVNDMRHFERAADAADYGEKENEKP